MDRLTRREPDGQAIALHGDCGWYGKIVQRLAAYEDTGLTPQEIKSMQEWHDFRDSRDCISADRLRALAEADRDGRCVVLPCKAGDIIYDIRGDWETGEPMLIPHKVKSIYPAVRKNGKFGFDVFATDFGFSITETSNMYYSREEAEAALILNG